MSKSEIDGMLDIIRFTVLSAENGKSHMGQVTQEMIKTNQQIDIDSVDTHMHCK